MTAASDLVPMPARPDDLLRVNGFYPFEEAGKRLLFVVENAAFIEADEIGWALSALVSVSPRAKRSALFAELTTRWSEAEAKEAIETFEQLEILVPADRPRAPADMVALAPAAPLSSLVFTWLTATCVAVTATPTLAATAISSG
jgi:hypothetical protein